MYNPFNSVRVDGDGAILVGGGCVGGNGVDGLLPFFLVVGSFVSAGYFEGRGE